MMTLLKLLGSLRLTLVSFVFLGFGILVAYFNEIRTSPWLVVSLGLLAVNLLAAVLTRPHFRRQVPLLVFHLAILTLILLVAIGRLTYFSGQAEVVTGTEFSGEVRVVEEGPWHRKAYDQFSFVNHGFTIAYAEGLKRLQTKNPVSWVGRDGKTQTTVIGDDVPLVLDGYRFYTSPNKGFALLFDWYRPGEMPVTGAVHLPSYPANALQQAQKWVLPGMQEPVWAMLQLDEEIIQEDQAGEFALPENYRVVLRYLDQRFELPEVKAGQRPGRPHTVDLPGGRLVYVGIRSYMGYKVTRDPTLHWLLAVSAMAVLALGWHFWRKFASEPWNPEDNVVPGTLGRSHD